MVALELGFPLIQRLELSHDLGFVIVVIGQRRMNLPKRNVVLGVKNLSRRYASQVMRNDVNDTNPRPLYMGKPTTNCGVLGDMRVGRRLTHVKHTVAGTPRIDKPANSEHSREARYVAAEATNTARFRRPKCRP